MSNLQHRQEAQQIHADLECPEWEIYWHLEAEVRIAAMSAENGYKKNGFKIIFF